MLQFESNIPKDLEKFLSCCFVGKMIFETDVIAFVVCCEAKVSKASKVSLFVLSDWKEKQVEIRLKEGNIYKLRKKKGSCK